MAIPKAATVAHVIENAAAREVNLSTEELSLIDTQFKPPKSKRPLEML
jgi:diketogulonate reductase-like aldo/keto reductase